MGVGAVRFAGTDLFAPGAAVQRNFIPFASGGPASRVIAVGASARGIPHSATGITDLEKINWFSNVNEAREILGSGMGYDYSKFILSPSPDMTPPGMVGFIRVNSGTQSTVKLFNADAPSLSVTQLTSKDYGVHTEQIRFKVETGTSGKKITVKYGEDTIIGDNIAGSALKVTYTGAALSASVVLDPAGKLIFTLLAIAGDGSTSLSITLATYSTLQALVDKINATFKYGATLTGDPSSSTSLLDKIVIADGIKTTYPGGVTTYTTLYAELQACIDWFNTSSGYISAVRLTGVARRKLALLSAWTYLTGGTDGSTGSTEWTNAIALSEKVKNVSFIGIATGDPATAAVLATSVNYMNGVLGRDERQGFCGATSAKSQADKIAEAQAIGNSALDYFGDSFYRYNDDGVLTKYDGFYGSAMVMGIAAGTTPTMPVTHKRLNVVKLDQQHTISEIALYVQGGVMVAEQASDGGFHIIRGITTTTDNNLALNEDSMQRTALRVSKDMRTRLESIFVGQPGDALTIASIEANAKLMLDEYADKYHYFVYDPVKGNTAWRNFSMTVTGDVFKIAFEATLVSPTNFVLVTMNFTVIGAKA